MIVTVLTIINTIMLVIVLGDRIKAYFEKATWDDKIISSLKRILKVEEK
jgi:hypothetical protein